MRSVPSCLVRQGERFHFRRKVPPLLREGFKRAPALVQSLVRSGDAELQRLAKLVEQQAVWISLDTSDPAVARFKAAEEFAKHERLFRRGYELLGAPIPRRGRKSKIPTWNEPLELIATAPDGTRLSFVTDAKALELQRQAGLPKLSVCIREYLRVHPQLAKKTKGEWQRAWNILVGLVGDIPVENLSSHHMGRFRDHLATIPVGKLTGRTITPTTQRKLLSGISTVLDFVKKNPYLWVTRNVSEDIDIIGYTRLKSDEERVLPFDHDQLAMIFSGLDPKRDSQDWIPWIALTTGARQDEICQLGRDSVKNIGDVWFFWINTLRGRRIKKMVSRQVPIHPRLTQLGFLKYVESRTGKLFDVTAPVYSHRFNRWLDKIGIRGKQYRFHSFRHTFKTLARECDVPDSVSDRISGHELDTVGKKYGGQGIASLAKWAAQISIPV